MGLPSGLRTKWAPVLVGLIGLGAGAGLRTAAGAESNTARSTSTPKADEPELSPQLAILELYLGPWSVTERHYDRAGKVVATVKGTEEVNWILDKHAINRAYSTANDDFIYRALGTVSYADTDEKYHGVWFDNLSTSGPMTTSGLWSPETKTMTFTVTRSGADGKTITHRVIERFIDATLRESTTYLLQGDHIIKVLEVQYKRAHPCPERIQRIFDG